MAHPHHPPAHLDEVLNAATGAYLAGQPIDMSALAGELGLSRATLYRRIGNHDNLLGLVLANLAEHTFRQIKADLTANGVIGTAKVLAGFESYINTVIKAPALHQLIKRDPLLFMRVVMSPGVVEDRLTSLLTEILNEEVAAGHVTLRLPTEVLAKAMVRIGDSFMYSHLLGGEPETHNAVMVVTLMLTSATG
ncbi:MAG TPA: QsdR family transcriptional regulator [Pseudonocardiaceae bacterium]|nr:QsdR family transcriptional regulator [Pseudonocardiaceae bacterium]